MKKRFFLIAIAIICLTSIIFAANLMTETKLEFGKNNLTTPESFKPIYVEEFVSLHPEIQTITLREGGTAQAYINYNRGIGNNFILEANKTYEISSSKNITLTWN